MVVTTIPETSTHHELSILQARQNKLVKTPSRLGPFCFFLSSLFYMDAEAWLLEDALHGVHIVWDMVSDFFCFTGGWNQKGGFELR